MGGHDVAAKRRRRNVFLAGSTFRLGTTDRRSDRPTSPAAPRWQAVSGDRAPPSTHAPAVIFVTGDAMNREKQAPLQASRTGRPIHVVADAVDPVSVVGERRATIAGALSPRSETWPTTDTSETGKLLPTGRISQTDFEAFPPIPGPIALFARLAARHPIPFRPDSAVHSISRAERISPTLWHVTLVRPLLRVPNRRGAQQFYRGTR